MIEIRHAALRVAQGAVLSLTIAATAHVCAQNGRITPDAMMDARAVSAFRLQYDTVFANFERAAAARQVPSLTARAREGRDALAGMSDQSLSRLMPLVNRSGLPSLLATSEVLASNAEHAAQRPRKSASFPSAPALVDQCLAPVPIDISSAARYFELIAKETTFAAFTECTLVLGQDLLGENLLAACTVPAVLYFVAQGIADVGQFCAGEYTANQVDGNYQRLEHLHNDLSAGITTLTTAVSTATTTLSTAITAATSTIVANDNSNKTEIINNDNANKTAIINNSNSNAAAIIANDNTNRDLLVGEIRNLACELIRLLNTPDGLRSSAIMACSGQTGFPYKWNSK
jgi:hypothetical protein